MLCPPKPPMNKQLGLAYQCIKDADEVALRRLVQRHPEIVAHGPGEAVVWRCLWWQPSMLSCVLELGADPDERSDDNQTPLMYAAAEGMLPEMRVLIEAGASVAATNSCGETPFGYAIAYNQLGAIRLLVEHGADPRATYEHSTVEGFHNCDQTYLDFAEGGGPGRGGSPVAIVRYLRDEAQKLDRGDCRGGIPGRSDQNRGTATDF